MSNLNFDSSDIYIIGLVLVSQRSTCINCVIGNKETYRGGDSNEGRHG